MGLASPRRLTTLVHSVAGLTPAAGAIAADELAGTLGAGWIDAVAVDFTALASADWKAEAPASVGGVALSAATLTGWTNAGPVNGEGLVLETEATSGSLTLKQTAAALVQAALGRAPRAGDQLAVDLQIAEGQRPWAPTGCQLYVFLGTELSGNPAAIQASLGKVGGGSTDYAQLVAGGGVFGSGTSEEKLAESAMLSVGVRTLDHHRAQAFCSTQALPTGRPLDLVDDIASNPSGASWDFASSGRTNGRVGFGGSLSSMRAGFGVSQPTSPGDATITILEWRAWVRPAR